MWALSLFDLVQRLNQSSARKGVKGKKVKFQELHHVLDKHNSPHKENAPPQKVVNYQNIQSCIALKAPDIQCATFPTKISAPIILPTLVVETNCPFCTCTDSKYITVFTWLCIPTCDL